MTDHGICEQCVDRDNQTVRSHLMQHGDGIVLYGQCRVSYSLNTVVGS